MARKTSADLAKEKAAKQKKMAILLSVVLVLAMGYAFKTMSGLRGGGTQPVAAATTDTTTTAATTTPTTAPTDGSTASLAAPTLAATTPDAGAGAPTTGAGDLVSSVTPTPDVGQLESFSRFASKDPFANGGSGSGGGATKTTVSTVPPPKKTKTSTSPTSPTSPTAPTAPTPPAATVTSAVIAVNGAQENVSVGGTFPSGNPMFDLLSLTAKSAKVSIVGGSYSDGSSSITLTVGKPVTLVNTASGTRYTLVLYPQGTTVATSTTTTTTTTTTTPTQTTTTPGT